MYLIPHLWNCRENCVLKRTGRKRKTNPCPWDVAMGNPHCGFTAWFIIREDQGITLEHCVEHGVKGSGGVYKRVLCYEIWATNWSIKYRSLLCPLWLNLGKRFQDQGHEDVFRDASLPDQLGMFFIGWQEPRKCHMLCPSSHRDRGSMDEDKFSLSFLTQYVELSFFSFWINPLLNFNLQVRGLSETMSFLPLELGAWALLPCPRQSFTYTQTLGTSHQKPSSIAWIITMAS